ncbi:MAG: HD domain-containing phosphohydrolase [Pseudomonadota bacterium]
MRESKTARILIVDDEQYVRRLMVRWLADEGYSCSVAENGMQALEYIAHEDYDLIVSDIMMPEMTGVDLLVEVKASFPDIAVLLVTGLDDRKTAIQTLELGAYGYLIKPFDKNEFLINVAGVLERRKLALLGKQYERQLETKVQERTLEVREREEEIILRLMSAMGYRDDETGAHIRRIGLYSYRMAKDLGWNEEAARDLRLAAPIHDVGKIGIPDAILLKPGPLTPDEHDMMKEHTTIGAGMLSNSKVPVLKLARQIALCHHEKWAGNGYPRGLSREQIPETARIVAILDVYDALSHKRIYRGALPEKEVLTVMSVGRGSHFDPNLFDCFMELLPEIRMIMENVPDEKDHS